MGIEDLHLYVEILAGIAEIAIVFLLWKTVKDFAETAKVSKIQTQHRFSPWIGPSSGIEFMREDASKMQYSVRLKNFGEIPALSVTAQYTMKTEVISKETLQLDSLTIFKLGPLLPLMEKRYWIFIDSDIISKAKEDKLKVFTYLYFGYEFAGGKSGYGMISFFDPNTENFMHKEMWID